MSINQEIEVLSADEPRALAVHDYLIITSKGKLERSNRPRRLKLGWTVKETIGIGIYCNIQNVSKLYIAK